MQAQTWNPAIPATTLALEKEVEREPSPATGRERPPYDRERIARGRAVLGRDRLTPRHDQVGRHRASTAADGGRQAPGRQRSSSSGRGARTSNDPEQLFLAGLVLLRRGDDARALVAFKQAARLVPADARFQSYVGLCLATTGKKVRMAVDLCERAVESDYFRADLLCNLGRVLQIAGDRRQAYAAYQRALELDSTHPETRSALATMGIRRPPPIPFLPRTNLANRAAGIVLSKLGVR